MKDKYGETIICMKCKKEIKDKNDLKIDRNTGSVYCKRCTSIKINNDIFRTNEGKHATNLDKEILGTPDNDNYEPIEYNVEAKNQELNKKLTEQEQELFNDEQLTDKESEEKHKIKIEEFNDRFEYQQYLIKKYGEVEGMKQIKKLFKRTKGSV